MENEKREAQRKWLQMRELGLKHEERERDVRWRDEKKRGLGKVFIAGLFFCFSISLLLFGLISAKSNKNCYDAKT